MEIDFQGLTHETTHEKRPFHFTCLFKSSNSNSPVIVLPGLHHDGKLSVTSSMDNSLFFILVYAHWLRQGRIQGGFRVAKSPLLPKKKKKKEKYTCGHQKMNRTEGKLSFHLTSCSIIFHPPCLMPGYGYMEAARGLVPGSNTRTHHHHFTTPPWLETKTRLLVSTANHLSPEANL